MDLSSFSDVVLWVQSYGYTIMFVAMVIEGPVVSAAAAFAAALGTFNIAAVFILSLLGDLVGDAIYYSMGYLGGRSLIRKIGTPLGFTEERFLEMSNYMEKNLSKAIMIFKIVPLISFTGFAAAGASDIKPYRFFIRDFFLTLPFTIFFVGLGYYSGKTFELVYQYVNAFQYGVLIVLVLGITGYLVYHQAIRYLTSKIKSGLEKKSQSHE
ncbi:MAG: VTT domain-containing protein [Anaplasmataceae bacterium]|nr:VTT domain-containing protein [Anaplasmataceae bacterium]